LSAVHQPSNGVDDILTSGNHSRVLLVIRQNDNVLGIKLEVANEHLPYVANIIDAT
jgi:hypothetical protein